MIESPHEFRSGAWTYLAFVLGWSSSFWLLSARLSPGQAPQASPIFLVGGAGPLIGAVAFTHLRESRTTQRDFWHRAIDPRLLSPTWLGVALLVHPGLLLLALLLDGALGSAAPVLSFPPGGAPGFLALAFFTFWFGPLPEEMGWRGYALDRLQSRFSALGASVVLGLVWACWHLPLFAVPGTFQHALGFGSLRFWIFSADLVPLSIIMTWVYNSTGRSTLAAALIHFSGNLCGALVDKTTRLAAIELAVLTACALVLVLSFGAKRLADPRTA